MNRHALKPTLTALILLSWYASAYGEEPDKILKGYQSSLLWENRATFTTEIDTVVKNQFNPRNITNEHDKVTYYRQGTAVDFLISKTATNSKMPPNPIRDSDVSRFMIVDGRAFFYTVPFGGRLSRIMTEAASEDSRTSESVVYLGPMSGYLAGEGGATIGNTIARIVKMSAGAQNENVNGMQCGVLEAVASEGSFRLWIVPSMGYQLVRLVVKKGATDLFNGHPLSDQRLSPKPGDQVVKWVAELDGVELQHLGDKYVPTKGRLVTTIELSDGRRETHTTIWNRSALQLNPDFGALGAFRLDAPDGTPVTDMDHQDNGVRYEWKSGKIIPSLEAAAESSIDRTIQNEQSK